MVKFKNDKINYFVYFFAFEEKDIQIYVFNAKISMNVCCTVIYKITVKDKHIL